MDARAEIVVVGAGAAGLMAAIWAGRTARSGGVTARIVALDGARSLGAKILVAGGGRCNVTHHAVDESAYAGSSRHAIKKVLRRLDVPRTVEFFKDLGVELKREETGKLFPTTDRARTVLDALLGAAREAGVEIRHPWRVGAIRHDDGGFVIERDMPAGPTATSTGSREIADAETSIRSRRVILATGGKALPKSGSDGLGYTFARSLGHTITPRVFPALVPLLLPADHWICALSGIAVPATLEVRSPSGKKLVSFTNSALCTHFGLSGPAVLDISRYYLDARADDPAHTLTIHWLPSVSPEQLDLALQSLGRSTPIRWLRDRLPERLADSLLRAANIPPVVSGDQLTREQRRALVLAVTETRLPITGDRGFAHAEVTAGGVPLSEIKLDTMESRPCPGLFLCGEICDADGRIGGFNFQWAWSSGYVAGCAAVSGLDRSTDAPP